MRLEAIKTVSVCLDRVQTYAFMTKIANIRVILNSATVVAHTSGHQVVKVKKKPINILQGLKHSQLRKLKYSVLTSSETHLTVSLIKHR